MGLLIEFLPCRLSVLPADVGRMVVPGRPPPLIDCITAANIVIFFNTCPYFFNIFLISANFQGEARLLTSVHDKTHKYATWGAGTYKYAARGINVR